MTRPPWSVNSQPYTLASFRLSDSSGQHDGSTNASYTSVTIRVLVWPTSAAMSLGLLPDIRLDAT